MNRVQMPAHTDAWMKGDRYGVVVGSKLQRGVLIYSVLLDKSGKTVKVVADDCTDIPR